MNKQLQNYAREELKKGLSRCTEKEQHLFKQMYANGNLEQSVNDVIDNMDENKLDWAMIQVARTLKNSLEK